jgi:hypothetical protein
MLKKAALAVFGLVLAGTFMSPSKAAAQVHIGVMIGAPAVVVQPAPVVVYGEPYVAVHYWDSGFHGGYYYDRGARYRMDHYGHRHYDDRYRDERAHYDRDHHDHGRHEGWEHHDHGHEDR